ncbi:AC18 [Alphabaculovirus altermyunipunctae]|uniref:AC18 n=1 Tax=Mythimna unipuncta nucleopolyhedrovirus TaxID=447897 RepID=A0A346TPR0_9ABAC|nr:AC18 [Mythimna unipuncta nucleopolyhedrovirus]AXU41570.1 AC18 [Mythimna unipuncta nucleopolyhedrovirus]
MNSLLEQLRSRRSIPYISKKKINDDITEQIMKCINFEFYKKLYRSVTTATNRFVVVKGGMAIAGLLKSDENIYFKSSDLDVQLLASVDDEPFNLQTVVERFNFSRLYQALNAIVSDYLPVVKARLDSVTFKDFSIDSQSIFVMFKSYINEAIVIQPDRFDSIKCRLNEKQPLKMTVSEMRDECYLVRFSFNVNVFAEGMYEYREHKRTRSISFFPLNLFFLDVTVVRQHSNKFTFVELFDDTIAVDLPDRVIIDQLECMFYNIFYKNDNKVNLCCERIARFLERFDCEPDDEQKRLYEILVSNRKQTYKAGDIKNLMNCVGSRLGVALIDELFRARLITTELKDITYQINFPYHIWDPDYFSKCWQIYLDKTKILFGNTLDVIKDN